MHLWHILTGANFKKLCDRKDSASFWAIKLAAQQSQRSKQTLAQTGIVEYFSDSTIPDKITGSESCIIAMVQDHSRLGFHWAFRIGCWSRALILKWSVSKNHKNFAVTENIPKFSWEVCNLAATNICFYNLSMNPLWKLVLCQHRAYSPCKFSIMISSLDWWVQVGF